MKSMVSEKGQVTIPKALRDRLGIRPGQMVNFQEDQGRLIVTRLVAIDPVERVYGVLKLEQPTDAILTTLRGKPDTAT